MLKDKVVVVTGGSKGMGRRFVSALVEHGAKVAVLARASAELDDVGKTFGSQVLILPTDVGNSAQVTHAINETANAFGRLDALVNNAGVYEPFLLENATDDQVERHYRINVLGPIWGMRAAIPHLKKTKGQIISISTEGVRLPYPYLSVYASSKAALEVLSSAMREELRADGIRVTALRSGYVAESTSGQSWDPELRKVFFEAIQKSGHAAFAGTAARPESMAEALVSILSLPADINIDLIEVRAAAAKQS